MDAPGIIRIEASAGSGKTYHLSIRYLNLIHDIFSTSPIGGKDLRHDVCLKRATPGIQPNGISAILAITFTNKAAAEMKERILLILKDIAIKGKTPDGFSISRQEAERVLFHIIENFSDFNVMTIDAFMNTILKAFAIEAGRLPDYDLNFNPRQLYELTLDRLMEKESETLPAFLSFLDHLLSVERSGGFDAEKMIRQALSRLRGQGVHPDRLTPDSSFRFDEKQEWESLRSQVEAFYADLLKIQEARHCFNAGSVKPQKHLENLTKRKFPDWIVDGRDMSKLVRKNRACPELPALAKRLEAIRHNLALFFTRFEINRFLRVLEVFRLTQKEEAQLYKELNLFDGSRLPEKVQDLLTKDASLSVPAAFCKLGERYIHYLIDEFQDTSQSQWNGMTPLIENSLSEGGTLLYVGDTKQAIYGWRGGDYTLMEKAYHVMPPAWNGHRRTEHLQTNWRSRRTLVNFFNRLFNAEEFGPALGGSIKDPSYLPDLKVVYKNSRQEPRDASEGGYILARFFPDDKEGPDPLQLVKEAFFQVLKEARLGYMDRDILILARKNEEIETIAGWLFEYPDAIPFVTEQSLKLFNLPPIKSILNLLSYLSLSSPDFYLHALVHDRLFGVLSDQEATEILAHFPGGISFETFFRSAYADLDSQHLAPLRSLATHLSPYELTRETLAHFEIPERFPGSLPLLDRLLEQVLLQEHKGHYHLGEMIETFYESTDETHLVLPETPDALRLMTIHKAKGLEADSVILPFVNWPMRPQNYGEIFEVAPGQYARLSKTLCQYIPRAEERKREIYRKTFIENFNLFYVAVTRARESLYLLVPPKTQGQGIGEIFRQLTIHHGYLKPNETMFTLGNPSPPRGKGPAEKSVPTEKGILLPHAEAIRSHLRLAPEASEETWLDAHARLTGNIAHTALSTVLILPGSVSPEETARQAVFKAIRQMGLSLDDKNIQSLERLVASALHDLNDYFSGVAEAWTEKELVSDRGEIIRIDRLVRRENEFFVLEFKTGREEATHPLQVKHYLRILKSLGVAQRPKGILYYLETGTTRYV